MKDLGRQLQAGSDPTANMGIAGVKSTARARGESRCQTSRRYPIVSGHQSLLWSEQQFHSSRSALR